MRGRALQDGRREQGGSVSRVAVLSLHTSPLVQPGGGDAGGMNVYVRELVSSLAQAGADATVYVRRWADGLPEEVDVEPGFRVVHVDAGSVGLAKEALPGIVDDFADQVRSCLLLDPVDVIHANYWLSGVAGHRLKHELDLPLVATFHTLARVKAETGDPEPQLRVDAEIDVIRCSDVITANSVTELHELVSHYGADPDRIEIVPPGVNHAFFSAGSQRGARQALGLGSGPVLLFVGRIQPLKGADVAVEALAEVNDPEARLLIVGGSSGVDGDAEVRRLEKLIANYGLAERVEIVEPQPHHLLSTYYRAADVCLVPSRSESFGLVRLRRRLAALPLSPPMWGACARSLSTDARDSGSPAVILASSLKRPGRSWTHRCSPMNCHATPRLRPSRTPGRQWPVDCAASMTTSPLACQLTAWDEQALAE